MARTIIDVTAHTNPWPIIDAWAQGNGYGLVAHGEWGRSYKRGDGFVVTESWVQVEPLPHGVRITAWVPWLGTDLPVDTVSFLAYVPRRAARNHVRALLAALGAPPL